MVVKCSKRAYGVVVGSVVGVALAAGGINYMLVRATSAKEERIAELETSLAEKEATVRGPVPDSEISVYLTQRAPLLGDMGPGTFMDDTGMRLLSKDFNGDGYVDALVAEQHPYSVTWIGEEWRGHLPKDYHEGTGTKTMSADLRNHLSIARTGQNWASYEMDRLTREQAGNLRPRNQKR